MAEAWELKTGKSALEVWHGGKLFTTYKFAQDQFKPWFYPLNGPSGILVTQEVNNLYPHHRSLWLGHGNVNGHEVWLEGLERGRIVHTDFVKREANLSSALLTAQSLWRSASGEPLLEDERTFRFFALKGKRYIDVQLLLKPVGKTVLLGKTNHALFSARVNEAISVLKGGKIQTLSIPKTLGSLHHGSRGTMASSHHPLSIGGSTQFL